MCITRCHHGESWGGECDVDAMDPHGAHYNGSGSCEVPAVQYNDIHQTHASQSMVHMRRSTVPCSVQCHAATSRRNDYGSGTRDMAHMRRLVAPLGRTRRLRGSRRSELCTPAEDASPDIDTPTSKKLSVIEADVPIEFTSVWRFSLMYKSPFRG